MTNLVTEKETNTGEELFVGTKFTVIGVKDATTEWPASDNLMEQAKNLGDGMILSNKIEAKYSAAEEKVIAYDTEAKSGNEIAVIKKIKDSEGNAIKIADFNDKVGRRTLVGKIISIDTNTFRFTFELYLDENEVKMEITDTGFTHFSDELEEQITRIVSEGLATRDRLEKNIKCMMDSRIGQKRILEVMRRYVKHDRPAWEPDCYYQDVNPEMRSSILNRAIKASLQSGHALVFEGDKSVGKNVCGETIACVRGLPYYFMGFDAYMTTDTVYGETRTDASAIEKLNNELAMAYVKCECFPENATEEDREKAAKFKMISTEASSVKIVREYSELVKWAKFGGVMMFNEYNMGDPNLKQQFMNPMLDSTRAIDVPGIGLLRLHPDCFLICSENPGFAGEMAENAATRSRLGTIKFPNASDIKKQLMSSLGENYLPEKYFDACNDFYKSVKGMVGTISDQVLNIRGFKRALEDVKRDILDGEEVSLADDIVTEVIDGCPEEDIPNLMIVLSEVVSI